MVVLRTCIVWSQFWKRKSAVVFAQQLALLGFQLRGLLASDQRSPTAFLEASPTGDAFHTL